MTTETARQIWAYAIRYGMDGTYSDSDILEARTICLEADSL